MLEEIDGAFSPAEVREAEATFTDADKQKKKEIIERIGSNLHLKEDNIGISGKRTYQAVISKEGLLPEKHQAATVGVTAKVGVEVKETVKQEFFKEGWGEVEIEEGKEELEIVLVEPS